MKQLAIFSIIFFLKINIFSQTKPCAWFTVCANDAWDAELAANPKPIAFVDSIIEPIVFRDSAISEIWNSVTQELPLNKYDTISYSRRIPANTDDFTGSVKVLYDKNYLYLLVSVKDNNINTEGTFEDYLDIKVVPYPNECPGKITKHEQWSYWGYEGADYFNLFLDGMFSEQLVFCSDCYYSTKDYFSSLVDIDIDSNSYKCEIAISFFDLMKKNGNPFPVGPDTAMGFNVTVIDRDSSDAGEYIQAAWSSTNSDIWATNLYCGILKFNSAETGVKYSNAYDVSISPNPVNDILTIKGINSGEITIVNLMGVEVLKEKIEPSINVSKLAAGVYFVSINDDKDKLVSVQKLLKY